MGLGFIFFGWFGHSLTAAFCKEQKEVIEMPDASRKVWRFGYSGLWPSKDLDVSMRARGLEAEKRDTNGGRVTASWNTRCYKMSRQILNHSWK